MNLRVSSQLTKLSNDAFRIELALMESLNMADIILTALSEYAPKAAEAYKNIIDKIRERGQQ